MRDGYLSHHGILNQKWGVRHGPPYPLKGLSVKSNGHIRLKNRKDETIKKGEKVQTLSFDKNRTNNGFFYASKGRKDNRFYARWFNKPIYDVETELKTRKWRIVNRATKDVKLANEETCANVFMNLMKKNRNFSNFVKDPNRMRSLFVKDKYKFKGYREVKPVYDKLDKNEPLETEDVAKLYRIFNYVLPNDGGGNKRTYKDVQSQAQTFFDELKDMGYDALADTNDRYYGGFKRESPMIVFNRDALITEEARKTSVKNVILGFMDN